MRRESWGKGWRGTICGWGVRGNHEREAKKGGGGREDMRDEEKLNRGRESETEREGQFPKWEEGVGRGDEPDQWC